MAQVFLLKNPLRMRGLSLSQRLGYFNSTFFWFFAFARVVFLLAPAAYLVFGLRIFEGNLAQFLVYAAPHAVAVVLVGDLLYGRVRWAFTSELYEMLQSMYNLPALMQVLRDPRRPVFNVTPKGETLQEDVITDLAKPFYAIYLLSLLSVVFGIWRWLEIPDSRDATTITMAWLAFNLLLLHAALGALFERRQVRRAPRMPANRRATLVLDDGRALDGRVTDLSAGGAAFVTSAGAPADGSPAAGVLHLFRPGEDRASLLHVTVRRRNADSDGSATLGLEFRPRDFAERRVIVSQVYGDSRRWVEFRQRRAQAVGVLRPFGILLALGIRYAIDHFAELVRNGATALAMAIRSAVSTITGQLRWLLFPIDRATQRDAERSREIPS
jgi:cellulose synthase (UDP-forming)